MRIADGIHLIDLIYSGTPHVIGAYLLTGDRPALVEVGPGLTVDNLLAGIQTAGLSPEALETLILTHIHLDHAGATGLLLRRFPHLRVYVQEDGAPHLIDPSRLLASASRLYGDRLPALWGEVVPVPAGSVHALRDGDTITAAGRRLVAVATPGHARHHLAFFDPGSGIMFTGDAAGVSLPGSRYVHPPTPPPEVDLEAWDATIERIGALRPSLLCLTHFGPREDGEALLAALRRRLHAYGEVVRRGLAEGWDEDAILRAFLEAVGEEARADGAQEAMQPFWSAFEARHHVQGYLRYFARRQEAPRRS